MTKPNALFKSKRGFTIYELANSVAIYNDSGKKICEIPGKPETLASKHRYLSLAEAALDGIIKAGFNR